MKTLSFKKPLTIDFMNEEDEHTVQITDVPPNFILPRVGETFCFEKESRQNIVIAIDHDYSKNTIFVSYDYFFCFTNKTVEYTLPKRLEDRTPKEKLTEQ